MLYEILRVLLWLWLQINKTTLLNGEWKASILRHVSTTSSLLKDSIRHIWDFKGVSMVWVTNKLVFCITERKNSLENTADHLCGFEE